MQPIRTRALLRAVWLFAVLVMAFSFTMLGNSNPKSLYDTYDLEHLDDYSNPDIVREFERVIIFESLDHSKNAINLRNSTYEELAKIPDPIRRAFIDRGWMLYVGEEKIQEDQANYDNPIMGITNYDHKYIAVKNLTTLLHEFGHFYQYASGAMDSFDVYYDTDKDIMNAVSTYAASTPHEFFATTFNCYIHDRICFKNYITDATKDGMPTTWGYFETMEAQNWM